MVVPVAGSGTRKAAAEGAVMEARVAGAGTEADPPGSAEGRRTAIVANHNAGVEAPGAPAWCPSVTAAMQSTGLRPVTAFGVKTTRPRVIRLAGSRAGRVALAAGA